MTYVSTPGVGTVSTQRPGRLATGAVVIAIGAALGYGIATSGGEVTTGNPSANSFTNQRQTSTAPAEINAADWNHFRTEGAFAADRALKNAVKQGQVPDKALTTSVFAEQTGQPR